MKTKKIVTIALAAAMISCVTASVAAETLTETDQSGKTEVTANIKGAAPQPGDPTYVISIPDVVDFGTLQQPDNNDSSSFKDVGYTVTLDELNDLDTETQQINVYVKDDKANVDNDQRFRITNKNDSTKVFYYDVYSVSGDDLTDETPSVNGENMTSVSGYALTSFNTVGQQLNGTLRIDQAQLYGYQLRDIIGDYSGFMVFYSEIGNA